MFIPQNVRRILLVTMAVCSLSFLTGCVQTRGDNAATGAIIGGITGALATSGHGHNNPAVTMLGTLAGAIIGSEIGANMDELDQQYADEAFYEATEVRVGRPVIWRNPRSGHHGRVIVIREGRNRRGEYYREFQNQVVIKGRTQRVQHKAYRRPHGWVIVR